MTKFHDIIIYGERFPGGVRFSACSDQEILEWTMYGLERGATRFETMVSVIAQ